MMKDKYWDEIIPQEMYTVLSFIADVGKNPPNHFCLEMIKDKYWTEIKPQVMYTVLSFIGDIGQIP